MAQHGALLRTALTLLACLTVTPQAFATGSPYPIEEQTGPCANRGGAVGQPTTIYRDGAWFQVWTCADGGTEEEALPSPMAGYDPDAPTDPPAECVDGHYTDEGWDEGTC